MKLILLDQAAKLLRIKKKDLEYEFKDAKIKGQKMSNLLKGGASQVLTYLDVKSLKKYCKMKGISFNLNSCEIKKVYEIKDSKKDKSSMKQVKVLTVDKVAELTGFNKLKVRQLLRNGQNGISPGIVGAKKDGREWKIPEKAVNAFLNKGKEKTPKKNKVEDIEEIAEEEKAADDVFTKTEEPEEPEIIIGLDMLEEEEDEEEDEIDSLIQFSRMGEYEDDEDEEDEEEEDNGYSVEYEEGYYEGEDEEDY